MSNQHQNDQKMTQNEILESMQKIIANSGHLDDTMSKSKQLSQKQLRKKYDSIKAENKRLLEHVHRQKEESKRIASTLMRDSAEIHLQEEIKQNNDTKNTMISSNIDRIRALKEERDRKNTIISEHIDTIAGLKEQIKENNDAHNESKIGLIHQKPSVCRKSTIILSHIDKIASLTQKYIESQRQNARLKKEKERLSDIDETEQERLRKMTALQQKIRESKLDSEHEEILEANEDLRNQIQKQAERIADIESELALKQKEFLKLRENGIIDNDRKNAIILSHIDKIASHKNKIQKYAEKLEDQMHKHGALRKRCKESDDRVSTLVHTIEVLEKECDRKDIIIHDYGHTITALKKAIKDSKLCIPALPAMSYQNELDEKDDLIESLNGDGHNEELTKEEERCDEELANGIVTKQDEFREKCKERLTSGMQQIKAENIMSEMNEKLDLIQKLEAEISRKMEKKPTSGEEECSVSSSRDGSDQLEYGNDGMTKHKDEVILQHFERISCTSQKILNSKFRESQVEAILDENKALKAAQITQKKENQRLKVDIEALRMDQSHSTFGSPTRRYSFNFFRYEIAQFAKK